MNWESYAILLFLNQILSKFKYRRRRLFFDFLQARKRDKLVQFDYFSGVVALQVFRKSVSSALAYLFIFKEPFFVLLYAALASRESSSARAFFREVE